MRVQEDEAAGHGLLDEVLENGPIRRQVVSVRELRLALEGIEVCELQSGRRALRAEVVFHAVLGLRPGASLALDRALVIDLQVAGSELVEG